jgi:hypothetical protein
MDGIRLAEKADPGTESSMARLSYVIGIGAGAAAFGVAALCVDQWRWDDPELRRLADRPGVVEMVCRQVGERRTEDRGQKTEGGRQAASPLVVQAEALAAYALSSAARVSEFGSRECGVSGREAVRA